MSKALYRRYRSRSLDEIVGQQHVTGILRRALERGMVAHAYLFTGPRGVGKTSIARILAHEINQLPYGDDSSHLDIIEIDAASNNGVEDVRDLREKVRLAPVSAKYKVYIIDEVHMLSKPAFNALLKTLEEPPEHAVFILATTDADKLPATIVSRTQQFNFRLITRADLVRHLAEIAKAEKITIDQEALELIAERGQGSFRDSISLLDQLSSLADDKTGITPELVEQSLGLAPAAHIAKLIAAYEAKDLAQIVKLLDESDQSGVQASILVDQLIQHIRRLVTGKPQLLPLLDGLLDVDRSTDPSVKLLTVLGAHAAPKPKSAAAEVTAPIKELEQRAATEKPFSTSPPAAPSRPAGSTAHGPDTSLNPAAERVTTRETAPAPSDTTSRRSVGEADDASGEHRDQAPQLATTGRLSSFDWQKLIDHTRTSYVAIYSVLNKCRSEINDGKLVIYTGTNFWKKKLDDTKHRPSLAKALEEIGYVDVTIETVGTAAPPKDSQAAAVAAIMGGGEEVELQ